jgi:cytochrome c oxidase cbb3-type subunit III
MAEILFSSDERSRAAALDFVALTVALIVILAVTGFCCPAAVAQTRQSDQADPGAPAHPRSHIGEKMFATSCAGCHGLDGQGSDRAPSIAASATVQHLSDAQVSRIIMNGIPGTGMPPFRTLGDEKVRELVGYLRALQGKRVARSLPGDAARGKKVFFGKGECSTCHTMKGAGGFLGPDLTAYGQSLSAAAILDVILSPQRIVPAGYRAAIITTRDGNRLEGMIRNEDNFSLQLLTKDGSFYFLQRSDVQNLEHSSQSQMPTNYREQLSFRELNDLVSYLMSGGSSLRKQPSEETKDPE